MPTNRVRLAVSFLGILLMLSFSASAQNGQGKPEVLPAVAHDVSPPLRNIPPVPPMNGPENEHPVRDLPLPAAANQQDPLVQTATTTAAPTGGTSFDGLGAGFTGFTVDSAPPDTNGSVGATQYVQWVNESFAVFNKSTGALQYGPAAGNTLWSGFGGPCQTTNDGDPIAIYDKKANRWVMTQFAVTGGPPYYQCVAVSQTSDATGVWNRYAFQFTAFNDYPKLGVWSDAYYITFNMFASGTGPFQGSKVCALDRTSMLAGAAATAQCFQLSTSFGGLLPADLDGSTAPPVGSPAHFLNFGTNSLNIWHMHVDFATPANTTLSSPVNIPVAAFTPACSGSTCIVQPSTKQKLDSLADRLMYRLAYRNFGTYESLVVNHSVAATVSGTSTVGVRWYEIRNPNGTPTVWQQGTFAPDTDYRWMGTVAMDKLGNMALGYSVSGTSTFPSIRYTGRLVNDVPGTMSAESSIIAGTGSQLQRLNRWGDYSSISVDPVDDCTMWFTTEYLKANGTFNWSTRIASVKFPTCTPAPPTTVSVTPNSGSGLSQTFAYQFSDTAGYSNINNVQVLINSGFSYTGSCGVSFNPLSGTLYLINDAANAWQGPLTIGQAGTLSNSQCTLNGATSSSNGSGSSLTVNLALTFNASFAGSRSQWAMAIDTSNQNSGWAKLGTWTPAAAGPPTAVSVTPSSGTGLSQTFAYQFSDPAGYASVSNVQVMINGSYTYTGSCGLMFTPGNQLLYLINDAANAWQGPIAIGQAGTLSNSQCTLNAGSSSWSGSGTTLTLNLALTFNSGFAGTKSQWGLVADYSGQDSGWVKLGTWTTVAVGPPTVVSVTPNSGTGSSQTFAYQFSDAGGYASIGSVQMMINGSFTYTGSCGIMFTPGNGLLYLINDAANAWQGPIAIGQAGTLSNSQCTINAGASSSSGSGNNLTVNLALTFGGGFTGTKSQWAVASDNGGQNSAWTSLGTWTP